MKQILVQGGQKLTGHVQVSGAKNSVLPIMSASLLASEGVSVLENVPQVDDLETMSNLLVAYGAKLSYKEERLTVSAEELSMTTSTGALIRKIRASILLLAPLLSRLGIARIEMPGGCPIGKRPIDLHLKALTKMGANIHLEQGAINAYISGRFKGTEITLDMPSVGATEQIMLAAVLAEGVTTIYNAAREPEIADLATYLSLMGAQINGAGSSIIQIEGVEQLSGSKHRIIPDRVEAGTYMIATAMTRGDVLIKGALAQHLGAVIDTLRKMEISIEEQANGIRVCAEQKPQAVNIETLPYPGFPTDLQAPFMSLLSVSRGHGIITETLFENRFQHIEQLRRLGASIDVNDQTAFIYGDTMLRGAHVFATDLRAGAALVCAALGAQGRTIISNIEHLERGYVNFVENLLSLGAEISLTTHCTNFRVSHV